MQVPIPVLFVLLPNVLMLDLAGPAEVLRIASQCSTAMSVGPDAVPRGDLRVDIGPDAGAGVRPDLRHDLCPDLRPDLRFGLRPDLRFDLRYVGPLARVPTSIGLPLDAIAPLPPALSANAIVVLVGTSSEARLAPGARAEADAAAQVVLDWLRRVVAPAKQRVMCVCSGALIAARAGLLDARQCTTHHALCGTLQALAPAAQVLENRLYVTDGLVSTSAGITAGIDMMLQLLADLAGPRLACAVAREMVVYLRRAGADPQMSPWLTGRNHLHPALHRVQDALAADPARPWSAAQMAQIACSSPRHLARLFQQYAGVSPLDYLHQLRVAMARALLAQSTLDMEAVAARAGFASARHLRRIWHKFDPAAPSLSRSG